MRKNDLMKKTLVEVHEFLMNEYPGFEIAKSINDITGEVTYSVEGSDYLADEFYLNTNPKTGLVNFVGRISSNERFIRNYALKHNRLVSLGYTLVKTSFISGYTPRGDIIIEEYKGKYGNGYKIYFNHSTRLSYCEYWTK